MRVRIRAEGFAERVRDLDVPAGGSTIESSPEALDRAERPGALRGLVRDFGGTPLRAQIAVEPGGHRAQADEAGTFELEVPPGQYEVEVSAPGFTTQRRQVTVEANGVVILNVDLRGAR